MKYVREAPLGIEQLLREHLRLTVEMEEISSDLKGKDYDELNDFILSQHVVINTLAMYFKIEL